MTQSHPTGHVVDPDRVPDAPLVPPSANGGLSAVFKRRYLLRLLVRRELSARYQATALGILWSYIQPGIRFAMYFFVIGIIIGLHHNVENYGVHVFAGFVFVHYFTEMFTAGTRSIIRNKALVQKMAMPREMFPVASVLVSAYHTLPSLLILTVACLFSGWTPDAAGVAAGLLGFTLMTVLGVGLALLFSAANVFFRDFQNIVGTLTNFIHFSVPMIYSYAIVSDRFGETGSKIWLLNPVAEAVLLIQRCFWVYSTPHPAENLREGMPHDLFFRGFWMLALALLFLAFAQWVFTKLEGKFPERLSS